MSTELIVNYIEYYINSSVYAVPPPSYIKTINQYGFNTRKDFLIGIFGRLENVVKEKSGLEILSININEIGLALMPIFEVKLNLTDIEVQESDTYRDNILKIIFHWFACLIRDLKAKGIDANKEFGMVLNYLSDASNDMKYLYDVDFLKNDISYLKNEIEKPIICLPNSISVTAPLAKSENTIPQTGAKADDIKQPLNISEITNNFDSIKIENVYSHFQKGLVEKKYLTESDLLSYLKAAFEIMTIPETLFKIKDAPTKYKVIKVFHEYYKTIAGKPHGKQKKYAALLGNYFEGYNTENVSSNFTK